MVKKPIKKRIKIKGDVSTREYTVTLPKKDKIEVLKYKQFSEMEFI